MKTMLRNATLSTLILLLAGSANAQGDNTAVQAGPPVLAKTLAPRPDERAPLRYVASFRLG